jgi:hypothetical protein
VKFQRAVGYTASVTMLGIIASCLLTEHWCQACCEAQQAAKACFEGPPCWQNPAGLPIASAGCLAGPAVTAQVQQQALVEQLAVLKHPKHLQMRANIQHMLKAAAESAECAGAYMPAP